MSRKASPTTLTPKISLEKALTSRIVLADTTYKVSTCPVAVLQQLVLASLPEHKNTRKYSALQALLSLLEENADELTRWYCIETLLTCKVRIPFTKPDGQ